MKCYVNIIIRYCGQIEVEAENAEEAYEKALQIYHKRGLNALYESGLKVDREAAIDRIPVDKNCDPVFPVPTLLPKGNIIQ